MVAKVDTVPAITIMHGDLPTLDNLLQISKLVWLGNEDALDVAVKIVPTMSVEISVFRQTKYLTKPLQITYISNWNTIRSSSLLTYSIKSFGSCVKGVSPTLSESSGSDAIL